MDSALSSAVSGLSALQQALDVVGGNLANVNTPGYKTNVITFKEALSQVLRLPSAPTSVSGSVNPLEYGQGVAIGGLGALYTQGGMNATGKPTDMAISGDGFFMIKQGDKTPGFTRNGNFTLDKNGKLTTQDGLGVQGWPAKAGVVDVTGPTGDLNIPLGRLTLAKATSNMAFSGNLDAAARPPATTTATFTSGALDSAAATATTVNVAGGNWEDAGGTAHPISYTLTKTMDNPGLDDTWTLTVNGTGAGGSWTGAGSPVAAVPITFDASGKVATVNGVAGQTLTVNIPDGTSGGQNVAVNLASLTSSATPAAPVATANGSTGAPPTQQTSATFFDSLGIAHTLDVTYTKVVPTVAGASAQWNWAVKVDGAANASTGSLLFKSDGTFDAANSTPNMTVNYTPTDGAAPVSFKVDFSEVTNLNTVSPPPAVIARSQDGKDPGVLQGFSVDADGTIEGTFSNGLGSKLGRLAIATFANKEGLLRGNGGLLLESAASGKANIQPPAQTNGEGLPGIVTSGALESSNVDVGAEFTHMIVAQRAFQANAKMVGVVDQILNELANLKQS